MSTNSKPRPSSFDQPQESDWHRMISEAAYYRAQQRGFEDGFTLDDWLAAEQQVREIVSPKAQPQPQENPMRAAKPLEPVANSAVAADEPGANSTPVGSPPTGKFARFAATQAAGDGIQGDPRKPDKTVDEKIGANMADRK